MIASGMSFARDRAAQALRYLSFEVRGLQAAAYVLAVCALLSSLLALVRDRLLAHVFGASATLDIYYAGFRIPDLIFVATGALVSVYMLIPELAKRNEAEQKKYIDTVIVGFSLFAVTVSFVAGVIAPRLLAVLFPAFSSAAMTELVSITRILLLQPILLGLSNILAAITQAKHRYALYSISPLLYNLGIIFGVVALYPAWGVDGLAFGVIIGAAMHFGIQIPSVVSDGFFNKIPRLYDVRALVHTALVSVPRALALSMSQLSFLGLVALAGTLTQGSIAIFMFAYNLQAVPLSIIGASYSVAAFPTLALALSRGERAEFIEHVATATRYVLFWSLPASTLILVLRAYLVRVILGSGAFDWTDTRLTAAAFSLFSLSLAAQGVTLLLVRGYYAAGRTFVPFIVAAGSAVATIGLGLISLRVLSFTPFLQMTERLLRVEGLPGSSVLGLAFAYAAISIIGAVILMVHFEMRFGGYFAQIRRTLMESSLVALATGLSVYIALILMSPYFISTATLSVFLFGFIGGVFGIVIMCLGYYLLESREFSETAASIAARIWRRQPQEDVVLTASAEGPGAPVS
jgi:putative peptidoglycan lipid II flippase